MQQTIIQQVRKYAGNISSQPLVSIYFHNPSTSRGSISDFRIDIEKMRKAPLDISYIFKKIIFNHANDHPTSQDLCWKNMVSASSFYLFQNPPTSRGSIFDFRIDIEKMRKTPLDTSYIFKKIIFNQANDHPTSQELC